MTTERATGWLMVGVFLLAAVNAPLCRGWRHSSGPNG